MAEKSVGKEKAGKKTPARRRIKFSLRDAGRGEVSLVGDFNDWTPGKNRMKKSADDAWQASVLLNPGRHEYKFVVDGEYRCDPLCEERAPNPFGGWNSVMRVE